MSYSRVLTVQPATNTRGQSLLMLLKSCSLCSGQQLVVELGKEDIEQEALSVARLLPAADLGLLVIDTENQFMARGLGVNVAKAANGAYYRLPTITTTIDGATKLAPLLQRISVE